MAIVSNYSALLNEYGLRWNAEVAVGSPVVVTFSFIENLAVYQSPSDYPGFEKLDSFDKYYIRRAIDVIDTVSGLDFVEVPDSADAQIRIGAHSFNNTLFDIAVAYAYYPSMLPYSVAGDVWFNVSANLSFIPGQFGFEVILHELGHALGLKHPHEGDPLLAASLDSNANTVMTYNSVWPFAKSTQWLDNQALSYYYGDAAITEQAVRSSYVEASNLIKIEAQLVQGQGVTFSGSQMNDLIIGTAGDDIIAGAAGNDIINGGAGIDRVIYLANRTDYVITVDNGLYTVQPIGTGWAYSANGTDHLIDVENISFLGYNDSVDNSTTASVQILAALAIDQSVPGLVYRFFNIASGTHFYTATSEERNEIIGNDESRSYEGGVFKASTSPSGETSEVAIYRFYNTQTGSHFYTGSTEERDNIIRDLSYYTYEGTGYYAFSDDNDGAHAALYRFYNTLNDSHFYTASAVERDQVINTLGHYNYEGVAYFVDL